MRILVVDDEDMISQLVGVVLAGAGVVVTSAGSLAEARELLVARHGEFEAMLLDLSLPDGDGEELLAELFRLAEPRPRVVLFSAVDPHRIRRTVRRYGVAWLPKPFEPAALRRALGLDHAAA